MGTSMLNCGKLGYLVNYVELWFTISFSIGTSFGYLGFLWFPDGFPIVGSLGTMAWLCPSRACRCPQLMCTMCRQEVKRRKPPRIRGCSLGKPWENHGKTMGKPWPWGIWIIHRKNIVNLCKSSLKAMEVLPGHLDRAQFFGAPEGLHKPIQSLDWFLGENLQETMVFYHEIWGFPVKFSLKPTQWSKDAKEQFLDPAANTCRIIIPWGVGSKFTTDRGLCPSEVIVVKWGIRQQNHVGYGPKPCGSYLSICLSIHPSIHPCIYLSIYLSRYMSVYRSVYPSIRVPIW